jgi:hypothetical protein
MIRFWVIDFRGLGGRGCVKAKEDVELQVTSALITRKVWQLLEAGGY